MKKYTGLMVLLALASSCLLAVKAAPDDKTGRKGGGANEAQIGQLDKRLSERIVEQQELLAMVEKLLGANFTQKVLGSADVPSTLSGQAKPAVAPAPLAVTKAVPAKAVEPPPPWWLSYRPQMIYMSGNDHYVVVNGKMLTTGQTLGNEVMVDRISDDAVVLRQGTDIHTYQLRK
ncbi:MAG: hypothetical protein ACOYNZ_12645 [Rhodoferax sp.]